MDTPEFRIVWEADRLEEAPDGFSHYGKDRLKGIVDRAFRTESSRQKVHKLFVE